MIEFELLNKVISWLSEKGDAGDGEAKKNASDLNQVRNLLLDRITIADFIGGSIPREVFNEIKEHVANGVKIEAVHLARKYTASIDAAVRIVNNINDLEGRWKTSLE